mmetsp:Transcript_25804/g.33831  ORF Transcript_25804/g.33831 Transcript_25804/m.33831 type:complete len:89 (-) Transcript_25804:115-381(-)
MENPVLIVGDFNCASGPSVNYVKDSLEFSSVRDIMPNRSPSWHGFGCLSAVYDHIFFNNKNTKLYSAEVLKIGASDHLPLMATFTFPN